MLFFNITVNAQSRSFDKALKKLSKNFINNEQAFLKIETEMQAIYDSSSINESIRRVNQKGTRYHAAFDSVNTFISFLNKEGLSDFTELDKFVSYQEKLKSYKLLIKNNMTTNPTKKIRSLYSKVSVLDTDISKFLQADEDYLQKLLKFARHTPAFHSFFEKHSQFTSLFSVPWNSTTDIAGLPSSYQSLESVQGQLNNLVPQNLDLSAMNQQVQNKVTALFNKVIPGDQQPTLTVPDSVAPLGKKLKDQLEYNFNLQSQRSNAYWPMTSDVAAHIGYRFTKKSVLGVGVSGKIGWGHSIQYIRITQQGFSIRSFLDYPLKGSFYVSGGFELNHQQVTDSLNSTAKPELPYFSQSGLIGITKIVSIQHQFFRKTKVQLLWDFLSYAQGPPTAAFKFRIGYTL
jgi:hypothetical protein